MSSSPGNIFWSHLCCENNTPNLIKFCSRKIDKMQQKMDNGNNMSACSRIHCLCLGLWWKLKLIFSIEPRFTFEWCRLLCPLSRGRGQADNKRAVFADVSICIFEDIFNPYEFWKRSACARVTTTGDHLTSTLHPSPPRKHLPLIDTVISNTVAFANQPVFPVREERNEIVSFFLTWLFI